MDESTKKTTTDPSSSSVRRSVVSNAKFVVEKFDGTNDFDMWQREVLDVLYQQELDLALEDKSERMSEKELAQFNCQACNTIHFYLAKDQKYFVIRETTAKELWQKLKDKYMTKSVENRLYLKKHLFCFQYKQVISMIEHLDAFNKIITDLQNLDVEIDDEDKALLLLNFLSNTYDHLTTTLLYNKNKIKFVDISNALVNNEFRRKDKSVNRDSTSEAFTIRGRSNNRKFRGQGKFRSKSRGKSGERRRLVRDECVICHQKGYWKKDCPNRGKYESNANVVKIEDEQEDCFTTSLSSNHSNEWIMDSECSYHMCPNKHRFSSLEEFDGGVVLIGNYNACQTKGIGTVRLKMHNRIIKTLSNVRYMPDLRKNHIALGVLDSKDYRVTMKGGVLKVA
ncbi:hypothetical protein Dimus_038235 [Dionaea muscipula]